MAPLPRNSVAVVVPTLNRLDDLRACLSGVRSQSRPPEWTIVVDNGSTDGTRDWLAADGSVTMRALASNVGAPGGFAAGMAAAFERGADWVWLLDDDAVPDPDALELLLARADGRSRVGGVVPTVRFSDASRQTGWLWGSRATDGHGQSPNVPSAAGDCAPEVDWGPFAGLLLARAACERVGPVRADYVLWHADVEYCLRIRAAGFRLLAEPGAVVHHPAMPLVSRTIAGRRFAVGRIAPWREYYDTRNARLLASTLRGTGFEQGTPLARRAWREARRDLAVLLADPAGPRRLGMRLAGALDGIRDRIHRRPELEKSPGDAT